MLGADEPMTTGPARPVGRDRPLSALVAGARLASAGHGGAFVVEGEAGIGKTTVLTALAQEVSNEVGVVWSRGRAGGDAPSYWPWAEILRELVEDVGPDRHTLLGDDEWVLRVVAPRLVRGTDPVRRGVGTATRIEVFDAVARIVERRARVRPVLLVIDDVQWADVASVLLLAHVAELAERHPILVVAGLRSGEAPPEAARDACAELCRYATRIALPGLNRNAIVRMLDAAGAVTDPDLVDTIATRTRGNPFFVSRLVALLASRTSNVAGPLQLVRSEVPSEVADVVRYRVARLSTPVARLLAAASVLGEDGDMETLATLAGTGLNDVLELFASTDGLLVELGPERYAFSHAIVRDSVYEQLAAAERRRLHLRALDSLPDDATSLNARARHAVAALPLGDRTRAVDLCTDAARAAVARLAYEEAVARLGLALEVDAERRDPVARGRLLLELGETLRRAGASERARDVCREAAQLVDDDPSLLARAALGYADPGADLGLAYQSSDPTTSELLERAIALQGPDPTAVGARLRARLASELYFSSRPERSRPLALEAVAHARESGDDGALVAALATYHDAFVVGQEPAAVALGGSEEIMRHARAAGDALSLLTAHRARLFDLLAIGDAATFDAEAAAFARLGESLRSDAYRWWSTLWRAMRALLEGRHDDAEQLAHDALALGRGPFSGLALTNTAFVLFFLRREQGRLADVEAATRAFAADQADIPAIRAALALLLAEIGKLDEAVPLLGGCAADGFARLQDRNWPASWFQLSRAAYLCRDDATASALLEHGRHLRGECIMVSLATVCLGAADLALAWLLDVTGDLDGADAAYRSAARTNARLGARSWLAQTHIDHAALLAGPDGPSSDESRALAVRALAIADDIGLVPIVRRARALESTAATAHGACFSRDGNVWRLGYGGRTVAVGHSKGLADLAWLLGRPHEPVPAAELVARQAGGPTPLGSRGAVVLDERARRELRQRLHELDRDLEQADGAHDFERAARLRVEREALLDAAAGALGLHGRDRRLGDDSERARKAVTARIRNAIHRIGAVHPQLAVHLERSVDTGSWCVYAPEQPVDWVL